jgi:hypothetical protein
MYQDLALVPVGKKRAVNGEFDARNSRLGVSSVRSFAVRRRPDFFIVGAPRCGTTALDNYLSQHPDIYMAKKEMHHFGSDLRFGPQFYRRDLDAYLSEFGAWNGQARAGESSVWYLFSKQAAAEIKAFNPDARIIIMLREPSEMLCSLYHVFRSDGNEHLPTFREALAAEEDRRAGRQIGRHTYLSQGLFYHEAAGYAEQVRRYFDMFGRDHVHVVLFDEFAAQTATVYGRVLDFLGVDSTRMPAVFPVINGNVSADSVKSPVFRNMLSDPLVRGTAIAMHSWLPRPVFAALQKIETRLVNLNLRHVGRPRLDPDLKEQLQREFTPEVERLGELLGRNLMNWTRNATLVQQPASKPATK